MKYITSTLNYEFLVGKTLIPKATYTREELAQGKRLILSLEDDEYKELLKNSVFKGMVDNGRLNVATKKPVDKMTNAESQAALKELDAVKAAKQKAQKDLEALVKVNSELDDKNKELLDRIGELEAENESLKADVVKAAARIKELSKKE
jgi:peptidoglycan hydrolase CwlO-like protein